MRTKNSSTWLCGEKVFKNLPYLYSQRSPASQLETHQQYLQLQCGGIRTPLLIYNRKPKNYFAKIKQRLELSVFKLTIVESPLLTASSRELR